MIKNYLIIALRNLFKQKVYSFINIFGLAVGIACCILIYLYVHNEWSYDRFHTQSEELYRAWVHEDYGDDEIYFNSNTPLILSPTLEDNIPEVEQTTRFYSFSSLVKQPEQTESISEVISMVDSAFFSMFDFQQAAGSTASFFDNPNTIMITRETASRYFDDENPLQETISVQIGDTFENFIVTGIMENPPVNSSIRFNFLIPFSNSHKFFSENAHTSWFSVSPETYVLLREGTDPEAVKPKLASMMVSVLGERYGDAFNPDDITYTVGLQPVTDIRMDTEIPQGIAEVSDPVYSYILAAVAVLLLFIACVNFMTLSISRSTSRAKEVGIRKTLGAQRNHLMYQFWGEALLMTILALAFGISLAELLLPQFNQLAGTQLQLNYGGDILLFFLLSTFLISFVAGIYPALILSGFKPVEVLKGRMNLAGDKNFFRKAMVVFQFAISFILIAGTLIVGNQLEYMRSKDLGYQKEQVVVINTGLNTGPNTSFMSVIEEAGRLKERLRSELGSVPEIKQVSMSTFTPVQSGGWFAADFRESDDQKRNFNFNVVDHDFIETYKIDVIQGRNFSRENSSDQRLAILVNQALADDYGWDNPVGRRLPGPNFEDHEIIGVVENFHYQSLYNSVNPLALSVNPGLLFSGIENISASASSAPRLSIRFETQNLPALMNRIEDSWASVAGGAPFNFAFVDQAVDSQYQQEERLSQIVLYGSILTIIIACLGLFGLASLMIVRRTKEIGVRKVLGASSSAIMMLVNKEFSKLLLIAFAIAIPVCWYVLNQWLQDFAYRIEIGIGVFLLTGTVLLAVAWITVSYQSVKATLINPVESLRNE